MGIPPAHAIGRALRRLSLLSPVVKPSLLASFFKALMNAWPTARRMRSTKNAKLAKQCMFCQNGQDSIEHFARCKFCCDLFQKYGVNHGSTLCFLALDSSSNDLHVLLQKVRVLNILFSARSTLFHSPSQELVSPSMLVNALQGRSELHTRSHSAQ